jgi:hypothetical protein
MSDLFQPEFDTLSARHSRISLNSIVLRIVYVLKKATTPAVPTPSASHFLRMYYLQQEGATVVPSILMAHGWLLGIPTWNKAAKTT